YSYLSTHPSAPPTSTLSLHDALPISALLLDPGALPGAHPVQQPRQLRPHGGHPGVRFGGGDGAGDGVPALRAVVAEHDQVLQAGDAREAAVRSEEHTSELQSRENLVCRLLLEKKK